MQCHGAQGACCGTAQDRDGPRTSDLMRPPPGPCSVPCEGAAFPGPTPSSAGATRGPVRVSHSNKLKDLSSITACFHCKQLTELALDGNVVAVVCLTAPKRTGGGGGQTYATPVGTAAPKSCLRHVLSVCDLCLLRPDAPRPPGGLAVQPTPPPPPGGPSGPRIVLLG